MSHTRRTRANSAGHAGQSNTPSSSGSQASNVAPLAPAKASSNPTKFEIEIPPLDDSGGDCTHWCKTVTLVLKYRGLWDVVDSSSPAPDPATDAQAHLEWSRRDQEAHLQLILALSRALRNCVLDATSAKEVWDTLKARYQGGGELHSTYLLERLFMTPFIDSEPMEPQIANVVSITCQLNNMGFPVSDQWLTAILKVKLPESWETLKTVLANAEEGKQTSKGVISQILAEEHRRIRAAGGDTTAYFTKSTAKGKKKSGNGKKCSHCNRRGHNVSECRALKKEQEETASGSNTKSNSSSSGKTPGKASAKVAAADGSDSDETVQVFMALAVPTPTVEPIAEPTIERVYKTKAELHQSNLQHGWLIDSGASRTMCSHRSWSPTG